MAIVHVKGHQYYTKSVRIGGRITSRSFGRVQGKHARDFREWDRIEREEKRHKRMRR
jgi:hypothetical protein